MILRLKALVSLTPNNQELGEKIRTLFNNHFADLEKLESAVIDKHVAIKNQEYEAAADARNKETMLLEKIGL